jgi:hypothetical protein
MSNNNLSPSEALALRRQALLAQCAMQRLMLVAETRTLLAPVAQSGWRRFIGPKIKVPLAIGGIVAGLLLTRPGRAMPLLQIGTTLWGIARTLLPLLRHDRVRPDSGE